MGSMLTIALMLNDHQKMNTETRRHKMQVKYGKPLLGGKYHKYILLDEGPD